MTNVLDSIVCGDNEMRDSRCPSSFCLRKCKEIYEFMRKKLVCGLGKA